MCIFGSRDKGNNTCELVSSILFDWYICQIAKFFKLYIGIGIVSTILLLIVAKFEFRPKIGWILPLSQCVATPYLTWNFD